MKLKTLFSGICVLLWISFCCKAQNPVFSLESAADSLFSNKKFQEAALAYERIYFLAKTEKEKNRALLHEAFSYKALAYYEKSQQVFDRIELDQAADSFKFIVLYESIFSAYISGKYTKAEQIIVKSNHILPDTFQRQLLPFKILVYNKLQDWAVAKAYFTEYCKIHELSYNTDSVYAFIEDKNQKSASKARLLSTILPGAGQLYAGKPGRAVTSFALQAGLAAFTVSQFVSGYYLTGLFTGSGLFLRFYTGGIKYAGYLAEEYNRKFIASHIYKVERLILPN